ncbi:hypothetical protein VDG1235_1794 [Verrucomicrobiia bacterium DG1235]|nr:hypothetical protein VDG1235_1794 [Verrucomicrobiae bacterium DG1235]
MTTQARSELDDSIQVDSTTGDTFLGSNKADHIIPANARLFHLDPTKSTLL